ncbi:sensor histidine kinase [Lichenibacterium dinghuense]|uniref:sensor histidine kinase n=1 Tax=Lichenibacterium dinghuense TaxID=2895977 RepID=UPI001F444C2A|nr:PAS domain-containing sensor histidine kinase [Lichenibacterium sp. 6Y81]
MDQPHEGAGRIARGLLLAGTAVGCLVAPAALAAPDLPLLSLDNLADRGETAGVSLFVGLTIFSAVTALLHLAGRRRWLATERLLGTEVADLRARLDRAQMFLSSEQQIVVAWGSSGDDPDIEGDLSLLSDVMVPRRILGFGTWLPAASAQAVEHAVERLRSRGEGFRMALVTSAGRHVEAEGRAIGGRAILRLRDVSGDRLELSRLRDHHAAVAGENDLWRALHDALPDPAWMRDAAGRIAWVNAAYARAVEARDGTEAVARAVELLDAPARGAAATSRASGQPYVGRVGAVVAGGRHMLDVVEVPGPVGAAGVAADLAEIDALRDDLAKQLDSQARTLDQLSTAVAIFDRAKRLVFHNTAYAALWGLDAAFLDSRPSDGEILDRLRAERRLPEQADYRAWKAGLMASYQAVETSEAIWYLPDGRTLRVVTNPNLKGGVIYLFDNVTERYHLESRFNAMIRTQGETLDTLKEAVAVFGTDGRLKLFNPAFADMWRLDAGKLADQPHIDAIAAHCVPQSVDIAVWSEVRSSVAGLHDARSGFERRLSRRDGSVVDCAAAPLPDGASLLTFIDVTAGVNVERMLTERNEALLAAERLRNDFVHHVSYELRSPLTNIIGFIQLLGDGAVGSLNPKQQEYAGYITKSSAALLAIINDILDLATIDMDAMELDLGAVDIVQTMEEAAEGVQDRLAENDIRLSIVALDGIGSFTADGKRLRQILFNLLSNAIGFSTPGQTVTLAALRRDGHVVFKVSDQGRGIPLDVVERVFDRFRSDSTGSRHRGVGLGLSIVKSLVELHHGQVLIDSAPGEGTAVTCIFPATRAVGGAITAAE